MTIAINTQVKGRERRIADLLSLSLFVILILLILLSLTLGRYPVPFRDVVRIVFTTFPIGAKSDYTNTPWVIVEIVRMPRILLVTLCGMALTLSGTVLQGVFRNPLVAPDIMGISTGAALGGVIAIMLGWASLAIVGMAFTCGIVALIAAFSLAMLVGRAGTLSLVLSGFIVGNFCGALIGLAETFADPTMKLPTIIYLAARQLCGGDL